MLGDSHILMVYKLVGCAGASTDKQSVFAICMIMLMVVLVHGVLGRTGGRQVLTNAYCRCRWWNGSRR